MLILLTVIICIFARQLGEKLGVIDVPDNGRKAHSRPTPLVGGIAIMAPVIAWAALRVVQSHATDHLALAILLCSGGVTVVGFIDDQRAISSTSRLLLLAIFSVLALAVDPALFVSKLHTASLGWIAVSSVVSASLLVLALAGFASSVNMLDGINGLVLSLFCVWSLCLALSGGTPPEISELVAAASFVVLLFNVPGRLFLGDSGAFAVSFTIGLLAVAGHNAGRVPLETAVVWFFLPVVDCLRLIPARLFAGRSPFAPDRQHFHHRLAERLGEVRATAAFVGLVAVTSLACVYRPDLALPCIYLDFALYLGFMLGDAYIPRAARAGENGDRQNVVALSDKRRAGR